MTFSVMAMKRFKWIKKLMPKAGGILTEVYFEKHSE